VKLGPQGTHSDGKLRPDDKGDLRIAVSHTEKYVEVHFGASVGWLAMPPHQARDIAAALVKHADEIERKVA
jgi:hypothetical protein